MANSRALDVLYGRGGGRRLPDPQTAKDVASIEEWRAKRDAMAAAAAAAGEQLDIFTVLDPEPA